MDLILKFNLILKTVFLKGYILRVSKVLTYSIEKNKWR